MIVKTDKNGNQVKEKLELKGTIKMLDGGGGIYLANK